MAIQIADFERVMNQVRVQLPGASEAGIKGVMFDVLDEFFDLSNAWTEWVSITLVPGVQVYQVYPQLGGMFNRLVAVLDSNWVSLPAALTFGDLSLNGTVVFVPPPGGIITFVCSPSSTLTANAYLTKRLILPNNKDDIPDAPSWVFPLYGRYIFEGIVGTMQMQPSKSYSDPTRAQYHLKRFRNGAAMARTAAMRSNTLGGQSWRFPRQMWTTSQDGGVSTPFPTPTGFGGF